MNCIAYGPRALLLQFADRVGEEALARCLAIVAELKRQPPVGMVEFVPAFTTILLEFDTATVTEPARLGPELIARLESTVQAHLPPTPVKEIPIRYDGEDLSALAEAKQMDVSAICKLHSAPVYRIYMLGFSPGFPYLGDLDPRLHTPRLSSPRPKVLAGSVAIGGEHTGIYTVDSPGGWNIIGHTPVKIFDPALGQPSGSDEAMFLLQPGDRVKFVPLD